MDTACLFITTLQREPGYDAAHLIVHLSKGIRPLMSVSADMIDLILMIASLRSLPIIHSNLSASSVAALPPSVTLSLSLFPHLPRKAHPGQSTERR